MILLNTKLWYHATEIPPTLGAVEGLSVSCARDFYLPAKAKMPTNGSNDVETELSNMNPLCVVNRISKGDIVFTQDTLPECELLMGENPNCEIILQADGKAAIAALRDIEVNEWISIGDPNADSEQQDGREDVPQPGDPEKRHQGELNSDVINRIEGQTHKGHTCKKQKL